MGDDGGFLIPTGNSPSTHILKPPHVEFPTLVHDEAVCMRAAAVIGLSTAETKLAAVGDSLCLLIERYDREKVNDHYVRIHQEDLCQALGLSPVEKDDVTLAGIGQLLDEKLPRAAALSIKKSLLDAHAFNAAIGANDAHGKNFSLILNGNSVHLAPLYDVISVLRVQRDLAVVNSPVAIGGETLFRNLTREHWLAAARELGINPDEALARVEHINSTAENAVLEAARQIELESMGLGFPNPGLVDSWREKLVEYRATARKGAVIAGPAARPAAPNILAAGGASLVLCGKPTVDGSPCRRVGWCPFHQNH
jgi:serine/threonine-protein kinase HipA